MNIWVNTPSETDTKNTPYTLTRFISIAIWSAIIIWSLICGAGSLFQIFSLNQQAVELARIQAQERFTSQALMLTNPMFMTREAHKFSRDNSALLGHLTSLRPKGADNKPDSWEKKALFLFESGEQEVSEISDLNGKEHLRLMRPLITKESCLLCHGQEGYEVGDIRGGLSVSVPLQPARKIIQTQIIISAVGYCLIWLLGLVGIRWTGGRIRSQVLQNEQTQLALQESEHKVHNLAQAIEQSPASFVITDLDTHIEYVNQAFCHASGYDKEELLGQTINILKSDKTSPETYTSLWRSLARGKPWKGELYNRRKDGSVIVEFCSISPLLDHNGHITRYVAVKEDITEKQYLSKELEQHQHHLQELVEERTREVVQERQRAEDANKAKTRFLSNTSHEIRTPMNAIIGLTHLLQKSDLTPDQKKKLEKIDTSASHLLSVINDILDLSKIEAGKLTLENSSFSLTELFEHIHSLLKFQLEDKGIYLTIVNHGVPDWLQGDVVRLRQALLNYIGNAIKFTEQGGITLTSTVEQKKDDDYLIRFDVEDTGIGIENSKINDLFKPFRQADESTTKQYGGTGLGLAITQNLASLMGGQVGASSTPGQGSTFWLTGHFKTAQAPLEGPSDKTESCESELRKQFKGLPVLLADDNEINMEVATELLEDAGFIVEQAENGRIAVEKARAHSFELILMDVQMPVMDGIEATRLIRMQPAYENTPILAMTANVYKEDQEPCIEVGMNDFIPKPVDPDAMLRIIGNWLTRNKNSSATEPLQKAPPVETISDNNAPGNIPDSSSIDFAALRQTFGDNIERQHQILAKFMLQMKNVSDDIHTGYEANDCERVAFLAHKLKSSSRMVGANHLSDICLAMEIAGKEGNWSDIMQSYPEFEQALRILEQEIRTIISSDET
ncbi:response regulator [uncultured Amphritea sp.]|uniref:response regulator n=1 Tax=uncultured Amphritea sp. TaxID=981605 RepID=UPI0025EF613F|nr:response regulator [uncultured Amphritea sp.]